MRIRRIAAASVAAGALITGMFALSAPAAAGTRVTDLTPTSVTAAQPASVPGEFLGDGVRIHATSDLNSATVGLGYRSHSVTVLCYTYPASYLTDNTTHVTGWVSSTYVTSNNAPIC
ncbi:SH3 domain-containing protein [Actinocatenispora comari]|uniref:SH3 domain-containing protein n=1 Tax=Actinocatenispora comari TaxID=2807577 RepID=A0A8J4ENY7_9ACTN|nr:SH3 domain-containing protein [Actinocatenispora comari]GIL28194.1 hypothetical protein NUM_34480 [Actinocatenispora comari]